MFFEQYSHEPFIAVVRSWHFSNTLDQHRDELANRMNRGYEALDVMERHLAERIPRESEDLFAESGFHASVRVGRLGGYRPVRATE